MSVRFNKVDTPHVLFMQGGFSQGSCVVLSHSSDSNMYVLTIDGGDFAAQVMLTDEQVLELLEKDAS